MTLSRIAQSIGESVTLKLNATAAALRAQGVSVIHLGGGEPKSKCPEGAIKAAVDLLETGEVRYAPASGLPVLKQAIVDFTKQYYRRDVGVEHVMASGGAKQALMCALHAVLDPGDEVVYPAPYWVSYPEMVRLVGGVPVPVFTSEENTFEPTFEDLASKVTDRTKAMIINSPNNPTGEVYSEELIKQVVGLCEERKIYLIMDDIYQRLIFDGRKPVVAYDYASDLSESSQILVINGVSKQYAMTGFRIGWAVGNRMLIEAMKNIQGHETSGTSPAMQLAAAAAIHGPQDTVDALVGSLEQNRDILLDELSMFEKVNVMRPKGTFYCLADFSAYDPDSSRLAELLIDKVQTVCVPGVEFGMEGHLRLSYCGSADDIREGLGRMRECLDG